VLRAGHALYFEKVVPLIGGAFSYRAAYGYLPRSMAYLPSTPEMVDMLRAVGFPSIRRLQLSGGVTQLFVGTKA
jgi:demethylmenaquinone methyltransferase/2-methoxy-6-polyprenyl-1,4-benzoquinol methylase